MKFALIGHPVAGSLSPRLMAAAYDGRHSYDLLDFERFQDAWDAFVAGYDGINVTAPFKQDAFARVDVLSPQARATGAVNLVVRRADGFVGYNTDVDGVMEALKDSALAPGMTEALVVGTGGAARAAVYAAQLLGCRVTIIGRSAEKVNALTEAFGCEGRFFADAQNDRGNSCHPEERERRRISPDLVIYTLPGAAPVPEGLPFKDAVVLEAEYRIPQLEQVPCREYISGRRWMLGQAVAGYRIFTGEEPAVEKMQKVL